MGHWCTCILWTPHPQETSFWNSFTECWYLFKPVLFTQLCNTLTSRPQPAKWLWVFVGPIREFRVSYTSPGKIAKDWPAAGHCKQRRQLKMQPCDGEQTRLFSALTINDYRKVNVRIEHFLCAWCCQWTKTLDGRGGEGRSTLVLSPLRSCPTTGVVRPEPSCWLKHIQILPDCFEIWGNGIFYPIK